MTIRLLWENGEKSWVIWEVRKLFQFAQTMQEFKLHDRGFKNRKFRYKRGSSDPIIP